MLVILLAALAFKTFHHKAQYENFPQQFRFSFFSMSFTNIFVNFVAIEFKRVKIRASSTFFKPLKDKNKIALIKTNKRKNIRAGFLTKGNKSQNKEIVRYLRVIGKLSQLLL